MIINTWVHGVLDEYIFLERMGKNLFFISYKSDTWIVIYNINYNTVRNFFPTLIMFSLFDLSKSNFIQFFFLVSFR